MDTRPRLHYREFAPPPALAPLLRCVWTVHGDAAAGTVQRVLPDACCDLIFDLAGDAPAAHWVGTQRGPLLLAHADAVDSMGLRLRPGAAAALMRLDALHLTDRAVALAAHAPRPWAELGARAAASPGAVGRALHALAPRIAAMADSETVRWIAWLESLRRTPLRRVSALAELTGLTTRTLERRLRASVGLSPRELLRYLRFEQAVTALRQRAPAALADVALAAGYADQAHFTREFGRFAGLAPRAWLAEQRDPGRVAFVQDS